MLNFSKKVPLGGFGVVRVNEFVYLFQLKRVRYQNKDYDLLSVNIEMGGSCWDYP